MNPPITIPELKERYINKNFKSALKNNIRGKKEEYDEIMDSKKGGVWAKGLKDKPLKLKPDLEEDPRYKLDELKTVVRNYNRTKKMLISELAKFKRRTTMRILTKLVEWHESGDLPRLFGETHYPDMQIINFAGYGRLWAYFEVWQEQIVGKKRKAKLTINQIALKHIYEELQITKANANEIVKEYGYSSGDKLYGRFSYYSSLANRKGKPSPHTKKKLQNKIELIESVIKLLPPEKQQRPKDEVSILKGYLPDFD